MTDQWATAMFGALHPGCIVCGCEDARRRPCEGPVRMCDRHAGECAEYNLARPKTDDPCKSRDRCTQPEPR